MKLPESFDVGLTELIDWLKENYEFDPYANGDYPDIMGCSSTMQAWQIGEQTIISGALERLGYLEDGKKVSEFW